MYKKHYTHFLQANPERLHFAAHSHHPWPDVSRAAHIQCWDDAARDMDYKWGRIFGEVIPTAQAHIARVLNLSRPEQICFAPNTHEFVARILSCFDTSKPLRILTSDSEFHSFARQSTRLEELERVSVERLEVQPFDSFSERLRQAIRQREWDLIFLSQVFYNTGFVQSELDALCEALQQTEAVVVIDGYHAFSAIPTDLKALEDRIFYLAGGYKYAQAGEGVCFMHVPLGCSLRPLNTGWFAEFGNLEKHSGSSIGRVGFAEDGFRFWGATFDPSGLYRFNAVMEWMRAEGLDTARVHEYVQSLQRSFLEQLHAALPNSLPGEALIHSELDAQGHFFTFDLLDAAQVCKQLAQRDVVTDIRSTCLRFGFGLYQTEEDIIQLFQRLTN